MWTPWLCWTWSVQSEKCSAYGVISLLFAGYIKDENAWAGKIWQSYREENICQ